MRVAVEHALARRKLARNLLLAAVDDGGSRLGRVLPARLRHGRDHRDRRGRARARAAAAVPGPQLPEHRCRGRGALGRAAESPARPSCRLLCFGAGAARSRRPALQCERRHGPRAGAPAAGPLQRGHRLERRAQGRRHGGRGPARRRHRGQGEDAGRARAQPAAASGDARDHGARRLAADRRQRRLERRRGHPPARRPAPVPPRGLRAAGPGPRLCRHGGGHRGTDRAGGG